MGQGSTQESKSYICIIRCNCSCVEPTVRESSINRDRDSEGADRDWNVNGERSRRAFRIQLDRIIGAKSAGKGLRLEVISLGNALGGISVSETSGVGGVAGLLEVIVS